MIKKVLAILLCICFIFSLVGCAGNSGGSNNSNNSGNNSTNNSGANNSGANNSGANNSGSNNSGSNNSGANNSNTSSGNNIKVTPMTKDYTDPSIYTLDTLVSMGIEEARPTNSDVDKKANALLKEIENNPDTVKPAAGGRRIYVANNGADVKGNGFSEDKPFATIQYANLVAKSGDVVLLKRGNSWRGKVVCVAGVSYGAYGKGNKPTVYGAILNAANQEWTLDSKNIYKVAAGSGADIGLIVFDHGKACGNKKLKKADLKNDYDFYSVGGLVYVYCSKGDPSKLYSDIELCPTEHVVKMSANSTIQNWRIMYGGAHGISITGSPPNVTVDGCIIGYIGGGIQGGMGSTVRYGNGIEVWGGCDGYTIKKCHVYQCYDAGITMQYIGDLDEKNILFEDNLLEYSVYNIEYFLNGGTGKMINVMIKDNIVRHGGYGWGYYSRPDKNKGCNIMGVGDNKTENFVVQNNIFDHSKSYLIGMSANDESHLPVFKGNTYLQYENARVCQKQNKNYGIERYGEAAVTEGVGDATGKLIKYAKKG